MRRFFVAATLIATVACDDKREPPVMTRSAMLDSADQVMFTARFNMTNRGVIRADLTADTAYFFDDNTRVELDDVHTVFYTAGGVRDAVLTSQRGRYSTRLGDMTASGNVVVVTEAGRRIETPELHYNQARNEFSSDSHFVMTEPGRRLEGIGFRSDPNLNNVQVLRSASGFAAGGGTNRPAPPAAAPAPAPARPESTSRAP